MQYIFQAMGASGDSRFRDMLMMTATEEFSHAEFLGHAVALNLEGAPRSAQEAAAKNGVVGAIMGGSNPQHILGEPTPQGVWTNGGPTMDGRGTYTAKDRAEPEGQKPDLGKARPDSGAQNEQM